MRTLIVDDEEATRSRLARLLKAYPHVSVIGEAVDGDAAVAMIETHCPDLILLDIEMPGLDGFEVLERIQPSGVRCMVVFVTAYAEHALRAFDADALGYLLKPITQERLGHVIARAAQHLKGISCHDETGSQAKPREQILRKVVGHRGTRMILLDPEEVLWFDVREGQVWAQLEQDSVRVNDALHILERTLGPIFFRARRTALVNLDKVTAVRVQERSSFVLTVGRSQSSEILVSERQAKALRVRIPGI